jgi:predicted ATP-dependent protease
VPIRQCFAVTGSVDQHGVIQAIGGANEKIEGFFDICRAGGLTGRQGVIIPASNVKHLMLRADVVAAAAAGQFRVIPMATIDQGLELLTGVPIATINQKIAVRLDDFAAKAAALARAVAGGPP